MPATPDAFVLLGKVIDGTGAEPVPAGAVAVIGDRIDWVGSADELPQRWSAEGTEVIDCSDRCILPGLVDAHTHLSFCEAQSEEELGMYTSVEYRSMLSGYHAAKVLKAGVTSASEAASTYSISVALRDAIEAGIVEGPRLSAAGRQITTHQGLEDPFPSWIPFQPGVPGTLVRSSDEILEAVRLQVKDGIDVIKVSGSADAALSNEPLSGAAFRAEEFDLLADEVHRLERHCAVHARTAESVKLSARAGFDWIFHASYMDDEGLDLVGERSIPLVPTLTLLFNMVDAAQGTVGVSAVDVFKKEIDAASEMLSRAHSLGVEIIAGSESGLSLVPFGYWHARELEIFVTHLGMSPLEAIRAGTLAAARTLPKWTDEIGSIEAGKRADLLVVAGDPSVDIAVLQQPSRFEMIFKDGRLVDPTPVPERRIHPFERTRVFLQGRFVYDEEARRGVVV